MGYYATGSGSLTLNQEVPEDVQKKVYGLMEVDFYEFPKNSGSFMVDLWNSDKYYEDDVLEALSLLRPYTKSGDISYRGEDECIWRFRFDPEKGDFVEETGVVTFDAKEALQNFSEQNWYILLRNDEYCQTSIISGPFEQKDVEKELESAAAKRISELHWTDHDTAEKLIREAKKNKGEYDDGEYTFSISGMAASISYGGCYIDMIEAVSYTPEQ